MAIYTVRVQNNSGPDTVTIESAASPNVISLTDGSTFATLEVSPSRGPQGAGWTGVTYSTSTGRFTFTSNDGLGYVSDDITVDLDAAVAAAQAAQTGAEAAEAATELLFDQFGDQYLGPKASDPTVDNDGNPLVEGAVYFNTTDDVLKFYSGTAWVAPELIATNAAAAASASETNAAASASAASTSASNAATSESNAATSAASAAASFDSFDDRYLGAKASDPTVDNDGDPLVTGALYFNSTSGSMRVYNGSAWQNVDIVLSSTDDLAEGSTNLYYTSARFDTDFSGKNTTDLTEGTNLYYTVARFDTAFSGKSTSDLSEGTNLYYTDARSNAAIDARVDKTFVDNLGVDAATLGGDNKATILASAQAEALALAIALG